MNIYTFDFDEHVRSSADGHVAERLLARKSDPSILVEGQAPHRIVGVNSAWSQLCGFSGEEAIGQTTKILQGELTDTQKAAEFANALARDGKARMSVVNYTKEKAPFVHSIFAKSVEHPNGGAYYLVQGKAVSDKVMVEAVMQRSHTQVKARQTQAQLNAILVTLGFGALFVLAAQGQLPIRAPDTSLVAEASSIQLPPIVMQMGLPPRAWMPYAPSAPVEAIGDAPSPSSTLAAFTTLAGALLLHTVHKLAPSVERSTPRDHLGTVFLVAIAGLVMVACDAEGVSHFFSDGDPLSEDRTKEVTMLLSGLLAVPLAATAW
jgi:hypothetical protein